MSTHSYIAIENKNGSVDAVYCHFDGYIEGGVGETLFTHYNERKLIKQLISHGEMSSLGDTIDDTDFYHRDHKELLIIKHYRNKDDFKRDSSVEYKYLFTLDNEWVVQGPFGKFTVLM